MNQPQGKTTRQWIIGILLKWLNHTDETLDDEVLAQTVALDQDILQDELHAIEQQFQIDCKKAKKAHMLAWLDREPKLFKTL